MRQFLLKASTGYTPPMITGTQVCSIARTPKADRAFFRDVLALSSIDVGAGWLTFAPPHAEAGIHPVEEDEARHQTHGGRSLMRAVVYFMCDDLQGEIKRLTAKKVECSPIETADWESK